MDNTTVRAALFFLPSCVVRRRAVNSNLGPQVFSAEAFAEAIDALRGKRKSTVGDLTIREVAVERDRFAAALSREVRRGRYVFDPAHTARVRFDGREREVFRSTVLDAVTERVIGRWLSAATEPSLSDALWSYRTGRSSIGALRAFGAFIRAHLRATPNVRERGLFVLRRDVAAYGKSIPSGATSRLWSLLDAQLGAAERDVGMRLLHQLVRRRYVNSKGQETTLAAGSPTGSPIQPPLNNLYLTPLDAALQSLPGHYARFGDDILFATSDRAVACEAQRVADTTIAELGLSWSAKKTRNLYFNGAGRPCGPDTLQGMPSFVGSASTEMLGYELTFRGTVRLPQRKLRALLSTIRQRVRRTARLNSGRPPAPRAEEVVGVVRATLDRRHALRAPEMEALYHVDDREQLAHLDHLVRLMVAQLCSRRSGPRAFRDFPPRRLHELGLPSLVHERNTGTP